LLQANKQTSGGLTKSKEMI